MPLFLCDREFVSDQRWRVDMNEFYEELKKVLDLSDGDVWTETVLCGKDAGKKRILSGIFAQDEEQNERPDEKKKENREKSGCEGKNSPSCNLRRRTRFGCGYETREDAWV